MTAVVERPGRAPARQLVKRVLVGPAMATNRLEHTLLPKILALPVFSSDPLSSVAYATEEMMRVLLPLSIAAFALVMPISVAIALLLLIVVASYRQTVLAYPNGGGAYIVSKENLGTLPGLVAAAALLTDYLLTVSVSVVAGVFAITSAAPGLGDDKVILSIGFVFLITLANLRGVRESGTLFAIPTYGFVLAIYALLMWGLTRCVLSGCPMAALPEHTIAVGAASASVPLFVILHAFSSGSTALTGVEAISNGVPAFRRPKARNAARTLAVMGAISVSMFLGISFLAQRAGAIPSEDKSMVAQIAGGVFGEGFMFYVIQVFTAAILVLAANTAYQDFPRLSSILARDGFMPKQFENRGDRLVFSNGVIVLAVLASALIYAFDADLSSLIQLYVVGVFTSFTLSQSGMVRHWIRLQRQGKAGRRWRRSIAINAVGAVTTGVVLAVVIQTKFVHGAWIVITAMPFIVAGFYGVHRHYARVERQRRRGAVFLGQTGRVMVVLYVEQLDAATAEAIGYVRSFTPNGFRAVHFSRNGTDEIVSGWKAFSRTDVPLEVLPAPRGRTEALAAYVRSIPRGGDDMVNVVIPELFSRRSLLAALRSPTFLVKLRLLREPGVVITDVPVLQEGDRPVGVDARPLIPTRIEALLFVSSVHDGVIRAINYALALKAAETRAIYFAFEPAEVSSIQQQWDEHRIPVTLDIVEAPFRDISAPIMEEVRAVTSQRDALATVIMPELVQTRWWHRLLHNQKALFIKRLLLFEPRVVLTSVPYRLGEPAESRIE